MYFGSANVTEREFVPPSLAISTVIFALRPSATSGRPTLWLPLVRRIREPYQGLWALPGGPLARTESLVSAAGRNLKETTRLEPNYLEQLYCFGAVDRSPAERVVSIVYWALVHADQAAIARETDNVRWFRADRLDELAFDHNDIVDYALWRLRNKVEYGSIAYHLLGERFTLAQLREVYEAVLDKPLDPANFRRRLRDAADIEPTDEYLQGGRHRPPRLYRYRPDAGSVANEYGTSPPVPDPGNSVSPEHILQTANDTE